MTIFEKLFGKSTIKKLQEENAQLRIEVLNCEFMRDVAVQNYDSLHLRYTSLRADFYELGVELGLLKRRRNRFQYPDKQIFAEMAHAVKHPLDQSGDIA